jgi:hypothetical protein
VLLVAEVVAESLLALELQTVVMAVMAGLGLLILF